MQISELAQGTGVSVHALRHYEKLGLLQPARRASGYRDYSEAMRREVVFIAMSRSIGFSLKAIAAQLPAYRSGRLSVEHMAEAMQERVADIDSQIDQLKTQRHTVLAHIAWMKKQQRAQATNKTPPPWPAVQRRPAPTTPRKPQA
ncbi:MerR family DNA-binding transcriptional regulator [Polaromonas sp. SM01]|uniref:MerR family DNA-binding transcriptional regulator n=1 Tax=Polaromonas sp. SM01 TaxID=3085630 RepID=UPI0029813CE7|nr:MerR family transcriptional regulator [Polaromonas sp. SM01]MDW5441261.1 MerR family DNA-binding transcriptional regulator [Polaromonas sp. SM01]